MAAQPPPLRVGPGQDPGLHPANPTTFRPALTGSPQSAPRTGQAKAGRRPQGRAGEARSPASAPTLPGPQPRPRYSPVEQPSPRHSATPTPEPLWGVKEGSRGPSPMAVTNPQEPATQARRDQAGLQPGSRGQEGQRAGDGLGKGRGTSGDPELQIQPQLK